MALFLSKQPGLLDRWIFAPFAGAGLAMRKSTDWRDWTIRDLSKARISQWTTGTV